MKRILILFFLTLMITAVPAHSDHDTHGENDTKTPEEDQVQKSSDGFESLYASYGTGSIYVIVEVLVVVIATVFAVMHYVGKSESDSIKELVSDRLS